MAGGMTRMDQEMVGRAVDDTKRELLAEVLRRCAGIATDDNARCDFGELGLQRPTEVAAELLLALSDEGLTIAAIREGVR